MTIRHQSNFLEARKPETMMINHGGTFIQFRFSTVWKSGESNYWTMLHRRPLCKTDYIMHCIGFCTNALASNNRGFTI
jgi:hypothetical protein